MPRSDDGLAEGLVTPGGWRRWLLRILQVVAMLSSAVVVARWLVSDAIWISALVVDVVALGTIAYLYRAARDSPR